MISFWLVFFCLIQSIYPDDKPNVDVDAYCKHKCFTGTTHTICEFKCELAPECKEFKNLEFTNKDRQYMLDLHNHRRNLVASGGDTRGGNQAAKDMMVLNYDVDIEITTLCWIRRCIFEHDKCREHLKYETAGQNLALQANSAPTDYSSNKSILTSVNGWYGEIEDTNDEALKSYPKQFPKMIGHYTQMVWHSTKFIGCSRASFVDEQRPKTPYTGHVYCNYSPAGNWMGKPTYHPGSGCTKEKPNSEYPSLCGEFKILSTDRDPSLSGASKLTSVLIFFVLIIFLAIIII